MREKGFYFFLYRIKQNSPPSPAEEQRRARLANRFLESLTNVFLKYTNIFTMSQLFWGSRWYINWFLYLFVHLFLDLHCVGHLFAKKKLCQMFNIFICCVALCAFLFQLCGLYLGYFIYRCTKEWGVCSPSCCVGLIFSISSPLMLTMMIWVVQLDRPGSRQVTAIQTVTLIPTLCVHEIKMSMELLFTFHRWPLNLFNHSVDRIHPIKAANAIKCIVSLCATIPGVTPTTSPL